jgi:hypothetical protein
MARAWYAVRKALWFWFVVGEWSWPQTHWRKWGEYHRWLREN